MNKYVLFMLLVGWLLVATYFVTAFEVYNAGNFVVDGAVQTIAAGEGDFLTIASEMFGTFLTLLFFNIEGIPFIVNIIFFKLTGFGFLYMAVDIIKDLIPFT